ncbi:MAG: hypothetical protein ACK6CG_18610, partial [Pseudanabaena sp.]
IAKKRVSQYKPKSKKRVAALRAATHLLVLCPKQNLLCYNTKFLINFLKRLIFFTASDILALYTTVTT